MMLVPLPLILVVLLCFLTRVQGEGFLQDTDVLPDGVSKAEAEQAIEDALTRILTRLQEEHLEQNRRLPSEWAQMASLKSKDPNQPKIECNTVLFTTTAEDIRLEARNSLSQIKQVKHWQAMLVDKVFFSRVRFGLRVWKLCGRCSEFGPGEVGCREQDYGYEALHSGLLIAPYDVQAKALYEGTRPFHLLAPGGGTTPSATLFPTKDPQVLLPMFITATTGAVSIMIDYIGAGESADYYRAYLNYQAVVTATVPLLWKAEQIISQQSNCAAAIADAVVIFGYSAGGHAAVSMADAMHRMGKQVLAVHPGGGPYRVSTTTILDAVEKINNRWYEMAFFIALLAAGLSSTNGDAANYGVPGQDFLAQHIREEMVARVQVSDHLNRTGVNNIIGVDKTATPESVLSMINPHVRALYVNAVVTGEAAPCITSVNPSVDKICQALMDQDVVQYMEDAPYPIHVCHSINDQLVPFENVPDVNSNPNIRLKIVSGRHTPSAVPCVIHALTWYANPLNLLYLKVPSKTRPDGCETRRMEHPDQLQKQEAEGKVS